MRIALLVAGAVLALAPAAAFAQAPAAPAAASGYYSTASTPIGTLLDDPAAKAILIKYIPEVATNPQIDAVRTQTLKAVQSYAPDKITDQVLANIDADLSALPPKK